MKKIDKWTCTASLAMALFPIPGTIFTAQAQDISADAAPAAEAAASDNGDIVVTAQKRRENINKVGISVQAASGEQLIRMGITDTASLQKIVPGFSFNQSGYGTPVFSIRGIGFQDSALAASPTVSVYIDEVPLPFSIVTNGASLDLERVEVLKGPQGTLYGENATGGAVNYIANKPTDTFQAGVDASYGRFNTTDIQGYVSGPITSNLDFRIAARSIQSGPWQKSYTRPDSLGRQNFLNGRASLQWQPSSNFKALLTLSGYRDHSETQAAQLQQVIPLNANTPLPAGYLNYPVASHNNRAADWSDCINDSGTQSSCRGLRKNNRFYSASLRMDYDLNEDITLTSLTSYQNFKRMEPIDSDGTSFHNYESVPRGHLKTIYQEVRVAGKIAGRGNWILGGNYQDDDTLDTFLQTYSDSTSSTVFGLPLGPTRPVNSQQIKTYAAFGNIEYPVIDTVTLQAGVRYTKQTRNFFGCGLDGGDGSWDTISQGIQNLLLTGDPFFGSSFPDTTQGPGIDNGPGGCGTTGPAPQYLPGLTFDHLNQDNVAWRAGIKWDVTPNTMLYANVSKGYKAGGFPTAATSRSIQLTAAVQESLLAYETGIKSSLFDRALQLNAAFYYYDYKDKQIRGSIYDQVFGPLAALVNVPKSHVIGFELGAMARPISGLTLNSTVSYSHSRIDGNFINYDFFGQVRNFTGESFPLAPEWQASADAQYEWSLKNDLTAFVGANISYQGKTNAGFGELSELYIAPYTLLDLRAGVETESWRFQLWGRNVTNKYYWTQVVRPFGDSLVRYTGMPATYGFTVGYHFR